MTPTQIRTLRECLCGTGPKSREEFAALLGVSMRSVFRWEAGKTVDRYSAVVLAMLQDCADANRPHRLTPGMDDTKRVLVLAS